MGGQCLRHGLFIVRLRRIQLSRRTASWEIRFSIGSLLRSVMAVTAASAAPIVPRRRGSRSAAPMTIGASPAMASRGDVRRLQERS